MLYIFDMGGVFTTTASVLARIETILGISQADFLQYCGCPAHSVLYGNPEYDEHYDKNALDLFSMCSDGLIGTKEFWRIFSERSGIAVKTDWWQWLFHPQVNEKTKVIIQTLKARGERVVCGTNTIDAHYRNHCERGDYSIFDQTYASCLMGVSKPNPDFWNIILTAENVEPSNAVFIDDKKINCDAASALGITSIQFKSAEQVAEALQIHV